MRELDAGELAALRLAAEGKLRTPKAKEVRRRNLADSELPTVRPKPSPRAAGKPLEGRKRFEPQDFDKGPLGADQPGESRPQRTFGPSFGVDKPFRPARPARPVGEGFRRPEGRPGADRGTFGAKKFGAKKFGPPGAGPARPAWKKDDRGPRPPARFAPGAGEERRPYAGKPFGDRPAAGRTYGARTDGGASPAAGRSFGSRPQGRPFVGRPASGKPSFGKPAWTKPGSSDRPPSNRPPFQRPAAPRREPPVPTDDFTPIKPGGLRIDPVEPDRFEARGPKTFSKPPVQSGVVRPGAGRPIFDRARTGKPSFGKPGFKKPGFDRPRSDRPRFEKPTFEKPRFDRGGSGRSDAPRGAGAGGSAHARPPRGESGTARPFTTSSGIPRAGGARPSSKPFKPGGTSRPRPGGFSKSGPKGAGFRGKPGGAKRSGPHSGGGKKWG